MGMLLDEAVEKTKDSNNEVLFTYCGGICEMCLFNRNGSKPLCRFCSKIIQRTLKEHGINNEPLTKYKGEEKDVVFTYDSAKELRALKYRDVNVGLGIMSNYISTTRNMDPLIDKESRKYFDAHLKQDVALIDAFYNLLDDYKPDVVYTFNGRFEEVRPVYDICKKLNIHLFLSEGYPVKGEWKKVMFENHLPHDVRYNMELRDYCWEHFNMTEEEKIKLGNSFYLNRRHGIYAGDKIYVKDQIDGNLPDIDKSKRNIAIMNSSEDEYAAVGAEWDSLKFFPSQYDGIVYLLEQAYPNVHFYLRIHPNLKDIKYKFHTELHKLPEKYDNVTVIPGDSPVSTYSLLDEVDKVVVFGSTMGVESVYWKKPVINLGPAQYSYDNVCYVPKDNDELDRMITSDLEPLFNDAIIRYGAYIMNQEPLFVKKKYVEYQPKEHKFIKRYHSSPFMRFWGGESLTALLIALGREFYGLKLFQKYIMPLKEA